jgi:hypothetical protein
MAKSNAERQKAFRERRKSSELTKDEAYYLSVLLRTRASVAKEAMEDMKDSEKMRGQPALEISIEDILETLDKMQEG